MRKHYEIAFPIIPILPILLVDWYQGGKHKNITLQDAKDAVFKAVLQGHTLMVDDEKTEFIDTKIVIIDKEEFERSKARWIAENGDKALQAAMANDSKVLP